MTTKYCGYEIGKDITCEQVERLFNFIHANYDNEELISLQQEQLNEVARQKKEEWW